MSLLTGIGTAAGLLIVLRQIRADVTPADYLVAAAVGAVFPALYLVQRATKSPTFARESVVARRRQMGTVVVLGIVQVILLVTYLLGRLWIGAFVGGLVVSLVLQAIAIRSERRPRRILGANGDE